LQFLGHLVVRLIWISIGVFCAALAASLFLSAGLVGGVFDQFLIEMNEFGNSGHHDAEPLVTVLVIFMGFISSFHVIGLAALPLTLAVVVAEGMCWQGMTINLVLGGAVALFTGLTAFGRVNHGLPSDGTIVILLTAGFIGGFFYWLIAGRNAGNWLRKPSVSDHS
jgi:hypothetical protein